MQGLVWPYSGGARAADRCNRNRAGQVGTGTVKRWRDRALLGCSSAGGGGARPGKAGEKDLIEIMRGSAGKIGRPCLRKRGSGGGSGASNMDWPGEWIN
jgi:hypothetical protein